MAQSGKYDLLAGAHDPPGNEELHDKFEELRVKSEDLRQHSTVLLGEAQNLCRASRLIRRKNLFLLANNPSPDARYKQFQTKKLVKV